MGAVASDATTRRFLESKLRVPRLGHEVVHRRRLTDLIERAVGCQVTAITAPAGAGKTFALAAWANAAARTRRIAWLTLDRGDKDPARFWANLATALASGGAVAAGPGQSGAVAAGPGQSNTVAAGPGQSNTVAAGPGQSGAEPALPVPRSRDGADDLPMSMVDAVRGVSGPLTLILDNVHELTGSDIPSELAFLIHQAPPALRLIVSGRYLPGLQLARLRVAGDVAELDAADLACTAEEADAYFAKLGLAVAPAVRTDLLRYTGGWMTGLRLAALAARRRDEPDASVATLAEEPLVADYLRDEILDSQPAGTQMFMLRTSVAEWLTGELADGMTGQHGGARVLDKLDRENYFVERLPGGRYRFYPVLRDLLRAELRRRFPAEVPLLYDRAARWHLAHGDTIEAVRYSAESGNWTYASHALVQAGIGALLPERSAELDAVLTRFPEELRTEDPAVAAALAAARLCGGDQVTAAAYVDSARGALDASEQALPAVDLWLETLRVMGEDGHLGAWAMAEKTQATAATRAEHHALGLLWFTLGVTELGRGDLHEARRALGYADRQLAAGLDGLRARVCGWQALVEALHGDLCEADRIAHAERAGLAADPAATCLARLAAAQVAIERDEPHLAGQLLDEAGADAVRWLPCEPDAGAIRARLRVRADGAARADGTAGEETATLPGQARRLLAEGDPAAAAAVAVRCLDGVPTQRERTAALLVAALARRRLGAPAEAADLLEQALTIAGPHGAYRPFLDMGAALHSAIAVLIPPTSPAAPFAARVLERLVARVPETEPSRQAQPALLSASELAVLRLLPTHLTNQEIAEALFLSVNTVKTHLRSIYHKLGAASRREAIAGGRRLQLL